MAKPFFIMSVLFSVPPLNIVDVLLGATTLLPTSSFQNGFHSLVNYHYLW